MSDPVVIVPYRARWPEEFAAVAARIRGVLGDGAVVDHIGSTAVPGLGAKDVLDVQVTVAALAPDTYTAPLLAAGFTASEHTRDDPLPGHADGPDWEKRLFREAPGARRVHVHVRAAGGKNQRCALAFRDYLRAHPDEAAAYERVKRDLAARHRDDRTAYVAAKQPEIVRLLRAREE